MNPAKVAALCFAVASCAAPPNHTESPAREERPAHVAIPSDSPTPSTSVVIATATAAPRASVSAPASAPEPNPTLQEIELAPGKTCIVLLHREESGFRWIDKIDIAPSNDCTAQTLFDLQAEYKADPQRPDLHEGLVEHDDGPTRGSFVDVNFDGFRDIRMVHHQGSGAGDYNSHDACWVYNPKTHTFRRNLDYERLPNATPNADEKRVIWGGRESGPYYIDGKSEWIAGQLVELEETETILGEDPNGHQLKAGFGHWEKRKQRQNGVLVKVFDGPVKTE